MKQYCSCSCPVISSISDVALGKNYVMRLMTARPCDQNKGHHQVWILLKPVDPIMILLTPSHPHLWQLTFLFCLLLFSTLLHRMLRACSHQQLLYFRDRKTENFKGKGPATNVSCKFWAVVVRDNYRLIRLHRWCASTGPLSSLRHIVTGHNS